MDIARIALGFDLRTDPTSALINAPPISNNQTLSPGLRYCFCADPSVWQRAESLDRLIRTSPSGIWNPLTLGNSLEAMLEACDDGGVATSEMVRVALTSSVSNAVALVERYGPGWFENLPTEEALVGDGWCLKGFDVIDLRGLISGLNGCGYSAGSVRKLRKIFGRFLNKMGLFDLYSRAAQFGETRGLQIPEHAPFVVVGVLVQQP